MEQRLNNFVNFFRSHNEGEGSGPQIGFKLTFYRSSKVLKIRVIGAKNLPASYGNVRPQGYLVKITVFPEKEKYETKVVKESFPSFNEEFPFTLHSTSQLTPDFFKGKFVSFTVYAALENAGFSSSRGGRPSKLKRFFSFDEVSDSKRDRLRQSFRNSVSNRRTIGAVTYNLDSMVFSQKMGDEVLSTPDIWREIKEITSGIQTKPREGKNGSVEMTLSYAVSEDRKNDVVEVSVSKFRCSLQTMQQHERIGGQLYIKITASEHNDLIQKMKSDRFEPTISLKLDTATLRATVNNYSLEQVKVLVRLISRNLLGKKTILGKIEIDAKSDVWKEIVRTPSTPVTRMFNLE